MLHIYYSISCFLNVTVSSRFIIVWAMVRAMPICPPFDEPSYRRKAMPQVAFTGALFCLSWLPRVGRANVASFLGELNSLPHPIPFLFRP